MTNLNITPPNHDTKQHALMKKRFHAPHTKKTAKNHKNAKLE